MIKEEIKKKIAEVVGEDNILSADLDRFVYSYDASFVPLLPAHKPDLVVRPLTCNEVSSVMEIAYAHDIPVTPRGAASGRTGGSIPLKGGISLSLERMTKIIELDEKNMTVSAEAGVRTVDLYKYCANRGLFYPPDPASWKFSTIGGNIAENAGGMRAVKYGVTGDYVMGIKAVLADGTVLDLGGKAIKNVTGYDLKSLFIGSEGTLGIITEALLKLIPLPKKQTTLQIMFKSLEDACLAVQMMLQSGVVPAAAEVLDKICLEAVMRNKKMVLDPDIEACLVIEIDGKTDEDIESQKEEIKSVARKVGYLNLLSAASPEEADQIWGIRRGISSALAALAPNRVSEDISVPRSAFYELVVNLRDISKRYGLVMAIYGHAGDGNIHPSILCDLSDPGKAEHVHQAIDEIFDAALALGGTLSGEHGIGITKRPYITKALGKAGVNTMKSIKYALDHKGILNPGKIW